MPGSCKCFRQIHRTAVSHRYPYISPSQTPVANLTHVAVKRGTVKKLLGAAAANILALINFGAPVGLPDSINFLL